MGSFGGGLEAPARHRREAEAARDPARFTDFPISERAAELQACWRSAAVTLYRNWLYLSSARAR